MTGRLACKQRIANGAVALIDFLTGDLAASVLTRLSVTATGLELSLDLPRKRPIDERIARLDDAHAALAEGLGAIDELREDAERAKAEHANVEAALERTLASREDAEKKLESIRGLIKHDVSAFQAVAGITSVRKERVIGFVSGICASIVASAVWMLVPEVGRWLVSQWH